MINKILKLLFFEMFQIVENYIAGQQRAAATKPMTLPQDPVLI